MYEICLGRPLPMNGQEWQDIRSNRLLPLPSTSPELEQIIRQMMNSEPQNRPSATQLLTHPQLLSDEQKALNAEKDKVMQANLQLQFSRIAPTAPPMPPKRALGRASTWSGATFARRPTM